MTKDTNSSKNKRPIVDLPYTQLEVIIEIIAAIGVAAVILFGVVWWLRLPEQIPSHFGPTGEPDAWSTKGSIWLLPGIGLGTYLLLTVSSLFPQLFNFPWEITEENAESQYRIGRLILIILKAEILLLFAYIQIKTIQVAMGTATGLGILFLPIALIIMFVSVTVSLMRAYKAK